MKFNIHMHCGFCGENFEHEFDMPSGWVHRYGEATVYGFCPKHSKVAEWADNQCPGCVGGWGNCNLHRDFAYNRPDKPLTEEDFEKIRVGICPRRTNGTLFVDTSIGKLEQVDLSEKASTESGEALVAAIKEYRLQYCGEKL